jgi:hypothetical protein
MKKSVRKFVPIKKGLNKTIVNFSENENLILLVCVSVYLHNFVAYDSLFVRNNRKFQFVDINFLMKYLIFLKIHTNEIDKMAKIVYVVQKLPYKLSIR